MVAATGAPMSSSIEDVPASGSFLVEQVGFREEMAAEGFASLRR